MPERTQVYRCTPTVSMWIWGRDGTVYNSNQVYNIYIIIVFVKRIILQRKLFKSVKRVLYFVMQIYPEK